MFPARSDQHTHVTSPSTLISKSLSWTVIRCASRASHVSLLSLQSECRVLELGNYRNGRINAFYSYIWEVAVIFEFYACWVSAHRGFCSSCWIFVPCNFIKTSVVKLIWGNQTQMVVVVDELLVANIALNRTLRSLLWYVIISPRFTTVTPVGTQYLLLVTRPSAGSTVHASRKEHHL